MLTILFVGSGADPFWVELDFALMSREARVAWCALHEIGTAFHTVQPDALVAAEAFGADDLRNLVALVGRVPFVIMHGDAPQGVARVLPSDNPDETAEELLRAIGGRTHATFESNEVFGHTGEWELPPASIDGHHTGPNSTAGYRTHVLLVSTSDERAKVLSDEFARAQDLDVHVQRLTPNWNALLAAKQHDPDLVLFDNLAADVTQDLLPRLKTEARLRWAQVVLFQKSRVRAGCLESLIENLRKEQERLRQEITACELTGGKLELSRRGPGRWLRVLATSKRGLQGVLLGATERVRFDVQNERVLSVWSERGGRNPIAGAQALAALLNFERGTLAVKPLPKGAPAPWNAELLAALKETERMMFGARLSIASPNALQETKRSMPPLGPRPSPRDVDRRKQQVVRRMAAWAKTSYAGGTPAALLDSSAEIPAAHKPVDLAKLLFDGGADVSANEPLHFSGDVFADRSEAPSAPIAAPVPTSREHRATANSADQLVAAKASDPVTNKVKAARTPESEDASTTDASEPSVAPRREQNEPASSWRLPLQSFATKLRGVFRARDKSPAASAAEQGSAPESAVLTTAQDVKTATPNASKSHEWLSRVQTQRPWLSNFAWLVVCVLAALVGGAVGSMVNANDAEPVQEAPSAVGSQNVAVVATTAAPQTVTLQNTQNAAGSTSATQAHAATAPGSDADAEVLPDAASVAAASATVGPPDAGTGLADAADATPAEPSVVTTTASEPAEIIRLRALVARQPNDHHAKVDLASALLTLGRSAEAVPLLEQAVLARPRRASFRLLLGNAYEAAGNVEAAAAERAEAARLDP